MPDDGIRPNGKLIRQLRERRGQTQKDLARKRGLRLQDHRKRRERKACVALYLA